MGRADEYLKLDAVGVLATDEKGAIKEQKLGRRAGKRGLGIGVALSVIAVMRRRDPSLRRNCAAWSRRRGGRPVLSTGTEGVR